MRHRKSGRKLNRNSSHRKAMYRNMCASLIKHELIKTTLPKAKELRREVEPLITLAKVDNVANRRRAFAYLRDDAMVAKLFKDIGLRNQNRPGGYLRILKCGFRSGDKATMAYVELVERESLTAEQPQKAKKAKGKEAQSDNTTQAKKEPKADKEPKVKKASSDKKED